jgi:hypothetical protein
MRGKKYTIKEHRFILENFPLYGPEYCAKQLGRTVPSIKNHAYLHNIKQQRRNPSWFKRNGTPWNKGISYNPEGGKATQFKQGHKPHHARKAGEIWTRKEKGKTYKYIKPSNKSDIIKLHYWIWQQAGRQIPKGHLITFKDGNTLNCNLENLICISRGELCRLNNSRRSKQEKRESALKGWETRDKKMKKRLGII